MQKYNQKNYIVYLSKSSLGLVTNNVQLFYVDNNQLENDNGLRYMFDGSEELISYCSSLISEEKRNQNLVFDAIENKQARTIEIVNWYVRNNINGLDKIILNALGASQDASIFL